MNLDLHNLSHMPFKEQEAFLAPCPFCGDLLPELQTKRHAQYTDVYAKCRKCSSRSGVLTAGPFDRLHVVAAQVVLNWNQRAEVPHEEETEVSIWSTH